VAAYKSPLKVPWQTVGLLEQMVPEAAAGATTQARRQSRHGTIMMTRAPRGGRRRRDTRRGVGLGGGPRLSEGATRREAIA
jgi:hypothetical protein